jgi:hypothetical protein
MVDEIGRNRGYLPLGYLLGGQHSGHFTRNVILYRFITTFGRFNTKNDENAFLYVDLNEGKFMFQRSNLY